MDHLVRKSEIRHALARKLEQRKRFLSRALSAERERDAAVDVLKNKHISYVLDHCADEIVNAIVTEALSLSDVVADQTQDNGDYVVGIDIPPLHIRRRVLRADANLADIWPPSECRDRVKQIDVRAFQKLDYQ